VAPELVERLRGARRAVVLSGSGISAESGVPTFRDDVTGLWSKFRPEELATPEAFRHDPELVWRWYQWRRELINAAPPNPGHYAIASWERLLPEVTVVTQNVDGLHQAAGSRRVIEFHGNIHRNRCSVEDRLLDIDVTGTTRPPNCPDCSATVRPDVVWFGEAIPPVVLREAEAAVSVCDFMVVVGTSGEVQPAADLAVRARQNGATVVEVNPQRTPLSNVADHHIAGQSGVVLPKLTEELRRVGTA